MPSLHVAIASDRDKVSQESDPTRAPHDVRIGRVLCEWQDAIDRGEPLDLDTLIARNPDIAAELRRHFEMLQLLDRRRAPSTNASTRCSLADMRPAAFVGTKLGPYKLVEFIGQGGMGFVFKAREERLHRDVAIKILRPEMADDRTALERFRREAQSVASLRHANIVTLYAIGEEDGVHFLVMEYVDGPTLAEVIQDRDKPALAESRRMFGELMRGLDAAHKANLIHRDIKSANILLQGKDRQVKIADFGLARMADSQTRLTLCDGVVGTIEYMSPEQAAGAHDLDHRTDLYSAGVVLHEMLAGHTPFASPTPTAVLHRVMHETPTAPANGKDDAELGRIAMALLEKRAEDRPASAADVLAILEGKLRLSALRSAARRKNRFLAATLLMLVLVLGVWSLAARRAANSPPDGPLTIDRVWVDHDDAALRTTLLTRNAGSLETRVLYEFPPEVRAVADAAIVRVGESEQRIAVAGLNVPLQGDSLWAVAADGRPLWHMNIASPITWPDCKYPVAMRCVRVAAADLDDRPGDEIVAVMSDVDEYATAVCLIDPAAQRITSAFWHMGHISSIAIAEGILDNGRKAIVARAVNNKLDGFGLPVPPRPYSSEFEEDAPRTDYDVVSAIMVLDPRGMDGYGPPHTARITVIKPCRPVAYAFLDKAYSRGVLIAGEEQHDPAIAVARWRFDELGGISGLNVLTERGENQACLRVSVDGTDSNGKVVGRTMLFLDRRLNLVDVTPINIGGTTSNGDLAYWKQYWRVLEWDE